MAKELLEVTPPERVVLRHAQAGHSFTMTMTFVDLGDGTLLVWRMRFDDAREAEAARAAIAANEQNFDRLAGHLATIAK